MRMALMAATILAATFSAAIADTKNEGEVGIITGMVNGTYAQTAADLTVLNDPHAPLRVLPIIGMGSLQNLQDILHLRGVDIGFMQADALPYAKSHNLLSPEDMSHIQYISKLYDEEIHVLARDGINSLSDLDGKHVNVDVLSSGSAMTAEVVLTTVGIHAQVSNKPQADALRDLLTGNIDAIIHVGGAPIPLIKNLPAGSGVHFVPLDLGGSDALAATYLPAKLTHDEYPNLIPDEGSEVPTIAIGDVMAVYAWDPKTDRGKNVARFVDAFFTHFTELQQPPRHPKWREVNPAAKVPGWTRFYEAQDWLDQRQKMEGMSRIAVSQGLPPMTDAQRAKLFAAFQAWLQQRRTQ